MSDGYNYPDNLYADASKQTPLGAHDGRHDAVNHPAHYTFGGIECIDAIEAALTPQQFIGFLRGQIIKYAWRSGRKGPIDEDAAKGDWYSNRLKACTSRERAQKTAKSILVELAHESQRLGLYDDNAYLASFGSNKLRDEVLRESDIGDVSNVIGHAPNLGNIVPKRHPMAAEADRISKPGDLL